MGGLGNGRTNSTRLNTSSPDMVESQTSAKTYDELKVECEELEKAFELLVDALEDFNGVWIKLIEMCELLISFVGHWIIFFFVGGGISYLLTSAIGVSVVTGAILASIAIMVRHAFSQQTSPDGIPTVHITQDVVVSTGLETSYTQVNTLYRGHSMEKAMDVYENARIAFKRDLDGTLKTPVMTAWEL